VPANALTHRVLEWCADDPTAAAPTVTVLLLHGVMDAAATWDLVAPGLADAGFRVLAPDLRGFGEGARVPVGGYYHFPDYVFDVADIVDAVVPPGSPLLVVGHSMGGTIATLYAGAFPERPGAVALLEGVGPPDQSPDDAPTRMRAWVDGVRMVRARYGTSPASPERGRNLGERTVPSRDEAQRRLAANHPRVPPDVIASRIDALAAARDGGQLAWRADPLHATRAPVPFYAATYRAFARRVTCPVLFVSGGPLGWHPLDEEERLGSFTRLERAELNGAGHMMHWTEPVELARILAQFARAQVFAAGERPSVRP
jgi:pimeloyl-ACP methyl ester carboxylesterase